MYTEYCPALNADWKHYFDEPTQVTYAKRGNQWITFDEKKTIQDKVNSTYDVSTVHIKATVFSVKYVV